MESLELKIFREVAGTNSISKAADNMGYVQSNVTAHIKKLDTELNTTLREILLSWWNLMDCRGCSAI